MMLFLAEDDLVIKDQIHLENGLAVVIAVCLLLAVVLVALVVWLARPSRKPAKIVNVLIHSQLVKHRNILHYNANTLFYPIVHRGHFFTEYLDVAFIVCQQ